MKYIFFLLMCAVITFSCKSDALFKQNFHSSLNALHDDKYSLIIKPLNEKDVLSSNRSEGGMLFYEYQVCLGHLKTLRTNTCIAAILLPGGVSPQFALLNHTNIPLQVMGEMDRAKQALAQEALETNGGSLEDIDIYSMGTEPFIAAHLLHRNSRLSKGSESFVTSNGASGSKAYQLAKDKATTIKVTAQNGDIQAAQKLLRDFHGNWRLNALDAVNYKRDILKFHTASAQSTTNTIKQLAKSGDYEKARNMWLDLHDGTLLDQAQRIDYDSHINAYKFSPARLTRLNSEFSGLKATALTMIEKGEDISLITLKMDEISAALAEFPNTNTTSTSNPSSIVDNTYKAQGRSKGVMKLESMALQFQDLQEEALNMLHKGQDIGSFVEAQLQPLHHKITTEFGYITAGNPYYHTSARAGRLQDLIDQASEKGLYNYTPHALTQEPQIATQPVNTISKNGKIIGSKFRTVAGKPTQYLGWSMSLVAGVGVIFGVVQSAQAKSFPQLDSLSSGATMRDVLAPKIASNNNMLPISVLNEYWDALLSLNPNVSQKVPSVVAVLKTIALIGNQGSPHKASAMHLCLPKEPVGVQIRSTVCRRLTSL